MSIQRLAATLAQAPQRQAATPYPSMPIVHFQGWVGRALAGLIVASAISACGGSLSDSEPAAATEASDVKRAMGFGSYLPERRRIEAATATAKSESNACSLVRPFYWEIGDRSAMRVSGSTVSSGTLLRYTRRTPMSYASASKWLYGAYVIQRTGGRLDATDIKFLSLKSGYTSLKVCDPAQTVDSCLAIDGNGDYSLIADGKFFYNSGHMQKHASLIGLGAYDNTGLATELRRYLGEDLPISYSQPQLAGGAFGTAETYARFLQKILNGQLLIRRMLGDAAVCTNPATCGISSAIYTPIPNAESWSYSLGHWVETDPLKGDNAFSSGGGLGFYPWIDSAVQYYGIVARLAVDGGQPSADCGRLIRKAWLSGVAQ